jgi:hypothetical protein
MGRRVLRLASCCDPALDGTAYRSTGSAPRSSGAASVLNSLHQSVTRPLRLRALAARPDLETLMTCQ